MVWEGRRREAPPYPDPWPIAEMTVAGRGGPLIGVLRAWRNAGQSASAAGGLIEPFMPVANSIGSPRKTNIREVVNALFYIASTGCQWRQLPIPPYSTVQGYFYPWSRDGT